MCDSYKGYVNEGLADNLLQRSRKRRLADSFGFDYLFSSYKNGFFQASRISFCIQMRTIDMCCKGLLQFIL